MLGCSSPKPGDVLWQPSQTQITNSTLAGFAQYLNNTHGAKIRIGDYEQLHTWSINNLAAFWSAVACFTGFVSPDTPLSLPDIIVRGRDDSLPPLVNVSWLRGTRLNFAAIVLRCARSHANRTAVVYRPESGTDDIGHKRYLSFSELESRVHALASALRNFGVRRGDAVSAVIAHTPDSIIGMLAAAAIGCVWSCCSPDFGERAICDRFSQTAPKVLLYTPYYRYKGKVYDVCDKIENVLGQLPSLSLLLRVPGACPAGEDGKIKLRKFGGVAHVCLRDFEGQHSLRQDHFKYEMITMDDPVLTMFSSGTTGRPKCILQGCGVLLNQMKEHVLHHEVTDQSCMLYSTSTGWMLFNWQLAALATGCRIVLYDGAAMPPNNPCRLIDIGLAENVTHFGSGAKYYQSLKAFLSSSLPSARTYLEKVKEWSDLRMVMGTGSPSTMEHFLFAQEYFGKHVQYVSMSGGTEINGCFALGTPWKPVLAPELQCAGLGMNVQVYNERGQSIIGESGELVCENACPCMPLYFGRDEDHRRYKKAYFHEYPNVWSHGDFAVHSKHGGFLITGRSDSTLNPGGVRIGTSDLYHVVENLDFVDTALVTEMLSDGDSQVIMFVVTKDNIDLNYKREKEICNSLRTSLSPRHVPHHIVQIPQVPITFSGKKCEIPVRKLLQGGEADNREAVKNPEAFDGIRVAIERKGLVSARPISKTTVIRASKM